jgi:hypothetical protein
MRQRQFLHAALSKLSILRLLDEVVLAAFADALCQNLAGDFDLKVSFL